MGEAENNIAGWEEPLPVSPPSILTAEPAEVLTQALLEQFRIDSAQPESNAKSHLTSRDLVGSDLRAIQSWLAQAHRIFNENNKGELALTYSSEWVLDNYYKIRQALSEIGQDLPPGYYRQLPKLSAGPFAGLPRIYAVACGLLSFHQYLLNPGDLEPALTTIQKRVPFTLGELWALPIFLRYHSIEALAYDLAALIRPQEPPALPSPPPALINSAERAAQSPAEGRMAANIILSLRVISEQNWNDFFEAVSPLEQLLRTDPDGTYPLMDFKTRDRYRKEIERLSLSTGKSEIELAEAALRLARENCPEKSAAQEEQPPASSTGEEDPCGHVGEYLIGKGRPRLEERIDYRPDWKEKLKRFAFRRANILYFGSILVLTALLLWCVNLAVDWPGSGLAQPISVYLLAALLALPLLAGAATLINWIVTLMVPPRILPKLSFKETIPPRFQTLVVIPALINNREDVDSLVNQIEMHYLRNPEPGLFFALLTDFSDADSETLEGDETLLDYAEAEIAGLNGKYLPPPAGEDAGEPAGLFYLLHRRRLWNPAEGKWMGWERKRGKLHELNRLLRGAENLTFFKTSHGRRGQAALRTVRFVITLDADTILPRGAACRLAGTLAHPLNRAKFAERGDEVLSGYTVLQPRMEIHPRSTHTSWFTRIFAGDTGLDLYTLAVSDVYQDLFGEGSYVGKGIYDVDAFERSAGKRIPENTVLSHDLLEGLMGRAGLVTDITMIEDYPQNYLIQIKRQERWIRGDWQLLPWLLALRGFQVNFSALDRWKIFDNLLRSLLIPVLVLIFSAGMLLYPQEAPVWLAVVLLSLGIPLLTSLGRGIMQTVGGENFSTAFNPLGANLARWIIALAFMPYEAYVNLIAIFTTLYRLLISRRSLLQWTTAAQSTKLFGGRARRNAIWQKMSAAALYALILVGGVLYVRQAGGGGLPPAAFFGAPLLLLWFLAPLLVWFLSKPIHDKKVPLTPEQAILLRQVVRRTWGFFERFVGPEDHWLPPDHFQEAPVGIIAHQTSPSNIGLLLTSTLAAYDFGFLDQLGLGTRLSTTLETMKGLERFRGHFLNWYDTLSLRPLPPRYVSTVDSGNLAASLIITTQACKTISNEPIFRWALWQGYLDTLSNLSEILDGITNEAVEQSAAELNRRIEAMSARIREVQQDSQQWYLLFQTVSGSFWQELSQQLGKLVESGNASFDLDSLRKLQEVAGQVERLHLAVQRTISELVPWIPLLHQPPRLFQAPPFQQNFNALRAELPSNPQLSRVSAHAEAGNAALAALRQELAAASAVPPAEAGPAQVWLDALEGALNRAYLNATALVSGFGQIAGSAEQFINEMDFKFLFDPRRLVFHIGYNLDASRLDNNFYDLLASEARIASLIAIAKGDAPQSHWLQLGRPLTRVANYQVLLSWSGTMFEYLMPPLFLRSYPGTLLAESSQGAVQRQIDYGKSRGVPWGISESGFHRFDPNQNYQYRAFGAPGLGIKRGLADDLVVAPYASLMAVGFDPHAVVRNLEELEEHKLIGMYGVYEAVDFTPNRLLRGEKSAVVQEYMAHHQGMIMMALANHFHADIMVRRMHGDPRIQSIELLLQEQLSSAAPLQEIAAEPGKSARPSAGAPNRIAAWTVPIQTPIPQVHLLSNGSYNVLLSNMGGGYSSWREVDLTRWQPDGVLDPWGSWIYIQEMAGGSQTEPALWSTAHLPVPGDKTSLQVTYHAHMAVYRRTVNGVTSVMEVTVAPEDPVEIRRIQLHNNNDQPVTLRLTSYGEVILAPLAADARHPAFNKLFIQSEFTPELNLQIFTRRPRSNQEAAALMGHMLVMESGRPPARHESDRARFIGRGKSPRAPAALHSAAYLTGTAGATLDPIFSLGQEISLEAHGSANLAYLTMAAGGRGDLLELARRYQSWVLIERTFHQASLFAQTWLNNQEIGSAAFKDLLQVLSALIYSFKLVRAAPEIIAANRLGQSGLWRFGISGDYPILLVEIEAIRDIDLVREAIQVHRFLRTRRIKIDLVILNRQQTDYGAELNGMLYRMVGKMSGEEWLHQRGGIYILYSDQIRGEEIHLLQTAARVVLSAAKGALGGQLPGYSVPVQHLPDLIPTRSSEEPAPLLPAPARGSALQFANGTGGFSADGREYVIELPPGKTTPAPWVNVIGYPWFGFMVSESGSQCTWAMNSGENRLTPWSNDPVRDPSGEILYLRDEETGAVWTPTPLPCASDQPYRVTHGAGYSVFEHHSHGLRQRLTLFASPEDPVKIIHLKLENTFAYPRRVTATQYVEWALGVSHAAGLAYITSEYDSNLECLLAANPYNSEFGARTAFLIASKPIHGLTADRTEFLGRGGSPDSPAALKRLGLETRLTPGEDPCAVLQVHLDLLPGASEEIYFVLGQGNDKTHALSLARKYHDPAAISAAFERTSVFWDHFLGAVQVQTPQPAADLMLNRWMLYQTLSGRVWGRTGFYQSSGAFGFRDQLQDVLALLPIDPAIARGQILNAALRQFEEGDVLHWWHPPSGRGVRTRFSDDLLWLPYVTALYIEATADYSLLEEKIPFLQAPPLAEGEEERYGEYPHTGQAYPLLEHCLRALEKGATSGPHGLPLIGSGDWNDGFNRIGKDGRGESVWLAWFLCDVLQRFAAICDYLQNAELARRYRRQAQDYAAAVEHSAWDGAWYRRAYFDNGIPLGASQNEECQIDAIAQSWAVLSGAGDPSRSRQAMQAVLERLVRPQERLSLLFAPPFDKTVRDPGYVKGYLPGIRENGGQYTHAAVWTAWAFAGLGDGRQAGALFDLLNPIFQSDSPLKAAAYRAEPYVICADIYSQPPHLGRGGWTWYTGSAAWMYRLGLEAILGFKKIGNSLSLNPVIPPEWDGFELRYRFGGSSYHIQVRNPEHVSSSVRGISLDGVELPPGPLPLVQDNQEHHVVVTLGAGPPG